MTITWKGRKFKFRGCDTEGKTQKEVEQMAKKSGKMQYEPRASMAVCSWCWIRMGGIIMWELFIICVLTLVMGFLIGYMVGDGASRNMQIDELRKEVRRLKNGLRK